VSAGHVVNERSTPAVRPPMDESNEAEPEQLDTARRQGDAYGRALQAMAEEDGAAVTHAGHYLVALVREQAEGMYAPDDSGRLVWREAPEEANAHIEVAVADGADGAVRARARRHGDHPERGEGVPEPASARSSGTRSSTTTASTRGSRGRGRTRSTWRPRHRPGCAMTRSTAGGSRRLSMWSSAT
jgi:hypothetical protein